MGSAQPLNYSPRARWRPSRTAVRLALITAAAFLCIPISWGAWAYLRDRLAFAHLWHRCEVFQQSPTTPVYSTDPLLVPRLRASGYSSWWWDGGGFIDAYQEPSAWDDLQRSLAAGAGIDASACAFLHSRRTAGQSDRLVIVRVDVQGDQGGYDPGQQHLLITSISPRFSWPPPSLSALRSLRFSSPAPSPSALRFGTGERLSVTLKRGEQFTIFAGQPDAADRARFTVDYTMSGKPGTIHGTVRDDGTVTLTVRDGPLARLPLHDGN